MSSGYHAEIAHGPHSLLAVLQIERCTVMMCFFQEGKTLYESVFKAGPPLEAILVIFGRRALIFFCLKGLGKK